MPKKLKSECFKIVNKNGEPVLFRTEDVSVNKFTFTITNLTGEALSLTGGNPVKLLKGVSSTETGGSSFNFGFESMLTTDVVRNLKLSLPAGWKAAFFEGGEGTPASWSFAPEANIVIGVNEVIKLDIENIKCSTSKPGNFEIMYKNIAGYADTMFPVSKHLNVLTPPDDKKKPLPLDHGYINPVHPIQGQTWNEEVFDPKHIIHATGGEAAPIYITYDPAALIQNGFTFVLTNTGRDPLVPAADPFDFLDSESAEQPVVYISFLFGEEDYAVTTQQLADNNISIDVNGKLPWQPSAHTGGTAYWQFAPLSKQIIPGHESVQFPVKKIITPLNVPADTISTMYIQVNNVPGYNDNVYTIQLQKKKAKAKMVSLEISKREIDIGENVTLTWVSSLAKRVTIDYKNRDDQTIILDSAKGDIKLNGKDFRLPEAPSAQQTVITLTAYDDSAEPSTLEKTVTVKQQPALIQSLKADPPLADTAATVDITLAWEVTNAQKLLLTTPDGEIDVTKKTGHVFKGLKTAFRFTLRAFSYYRMTPEIASKITDVFSFKAEKPIPLAMHAEKIQPQPAILINKQRGRVYVVNNSDNSVSDIDANRLSLDRKYPGDVMILSQNGEKLFVFNPTPGPKTFGTTIYDTGSGHGSRNYFIYSEVVGRYPGENMVLTPDLKKFYCSVNFKMAAANYINMQSYDVDVATNSMKYARSVTGVGDGIYTIALNNKGDKLYIAYNTWIEVKTLADLSGYKRLQLPATDPTMFACNKTGGKLYLGCQNGNTVVVVDTNADSITHWVTLKNKPVNLVMSPDDKYLFVAIYDTNEIAVISTATNEVVSTIITGKSPYGMITDSAGDLLFTANYCAKTLSVYDLKNNRMLASNLNTGATQGNPFDVGMYEDKDGNIKVFVAKEAYPQRITCAGETKNTGLDVSVFSFQKPKNT